MLQSHPCNRKSTYSQLFEQTYNQNSRDIAPLIDICSVSVVNDLAIFMQIDSLQDEH